MINQPLAKLGGVDDLPVPALIIRLTKKRTLIEPALPRPGKFEIQSIFNVHIPTLNILSNSDSRQFKKTKKLLLSNIWIVKALLIF